MSRSGRISISVLTLLLLAANFPLVVADDSAHAPQHQADLPQMLQVD